MPNVTDRLVLLKASHIYHKSIANLVKDSELPVWVQRPFKSLQTRSLHKGWDAKEKTKAQDKGEGPHLCIPMVLWHAFISVTF